MFLVLYTLLPFALFTLCNIYLIMTVVVSKRNITGGHLTNTSAEKQKIRMGITIIIMSVFFCLCTLPTASIQGSTLNFLLTLDYGTVIIHFCNMFAFTFQAAHFVMLYLTNSQFSNEFKTMCKAKINSETGVTVTNTINLSENSKRKILEI